MFSLTRKAIVAATIGCLVLTGCGQRTSSAPKQCLPFRDVPTAVAVLTGNHEGNPMPRLTTQTAKMLTAGLCHRMVAVVTGDGNPEVLPNETLTLDEFGKNVDGNDGVLKRNSMRVEESLEISPKADGADTWAAIAKAAAALRGYTEAKTRTLIVLDNGLADKGALNFAKAGTLMADPGEVVKQLAAKGLLLDLTGINILLSGLGSTTAPQPPLSPKAKDNITNIYVEALTASGAKVEVDSTPRDGSSVETKGKRVAKTNEPNASGFCGTRREVFDGRSDVKFVGDHDYFSDDKAEKKAHQALDPLSRWLREDERRTVKIEGTTARAQSRQYQEELGRKRAETVARYLIEQGAKASQITTKGVGSYFDEYVNDSDGNGGLDESVAWVNRSIRIEMTSPC